MGFTAVVLVNMDFLSDAEKNPEFAKELGNAILRHHRTFGKADENGYRPNTSGPNGTTVIALEHADQVHVYAVGGGTGMELGYACDYPVFWKPYKEAVVDILRSIALGAGFHLRSRFPKKKASITAGT